MPLTLSIVLVVLEALAISYCFYREFKFKPEGFVIQGYEYVYSEANLQRAFVQLINSTPSDE